MADETPTSPSAASSVLTTKKTERGPFKKSIRIVRTGEKTRATKHWETETQENGAATSSGESQVPGWPALQN